MLSKLYFLFYSWRQKKKPRKVIFFCLLIFFSAKAESSTISIDIDKTLNQISLTDRFYLRFFFKNLIYENHGGHTLFFQKPVSLMSYITKISENITPLYFNRHKNNLLNRSWEVWKQHQSLFNFSNFIFLEEKMQYEYLNSHTDLVNIYFINKSGLLKVLSDNEELFKKILGEGFSPKKLIAEIEKKESLMPLINNNEGLLGILLGYGRESSMTYESKISDIQEFGFKETGLHAHEAQKLPRNRILPVVFLGNPNSLEASNLINRYSEELKEIKIVYCHRDLLKTTLCQLCEDR